MYVTTNMLTQVHNLHVARNYNFVHNLQYKTV